MDVELRTSTVPDADALVALYDAVGWSAYTRDPDALVRAVEGSSDTVTAWIGDTLVGLARVLTDGASVLYLQDVLVHPEHQRRGIGRALVEELLSRHPDVRQRVLLTDDEPGQHAFYRDLGYVPAAEVAGGPLTAFVRLSR